MTRDEIRDRINAEDIRTIVDRLGIQRDRCGTGWVCPECHSGTGSHGTGMHYYRDTNKLHCFACDHTYDVVEIIRAVHGCDYPSAVQIGADMLGIAQDDAPSCRHTEPRQTPQAAPQRTERDEPAHDYSDVLKRAQAALTDDSAGAEYLRSRGLNVDVARAAEIGFAPEWRHPTVSDRVPTSPRILIPMDTGGYEARDIRSDAELERLGVLKYRKQSVSPKGTFHVSALTGTQPVHIVEGWADALAVMSAGGAAVALNGTSGRAQFLRDVDAMRERGDAVPPLILSLDADGAGQGAQAELAAELNTRNIRHATGTICLSNPDNPKARLDPADSYRVNGPEFAHRVKEDGRKAALRSAERRGGRVIRDEGAASYDAVGFDPDVDACVRYRDRRTGFANIDAQVPFYPGLYCVGAITSLGKTTFCLQLADWLAAHGEHVLYFSVEQDRRTMHAKSIARIAYEMVGDGAPLAIDIAMGAMGPLIDDARAAYRDAVGDRLTVFSNVLNLRPMDIDATVRDYADRNGQAPVVVVDYIQRLTPDDPRATERAAMDHAVSVLQGLMLDLHATVIAVSSLNRTAYLQPISYESVKESGGLEFTADVFWGLELGCMRAPMFEDEKGPVKKRNLIQIAKSEIPREIRLVCLKNRFGASSYEVLFHYMPNHEYYDALTENDERVRVCTDGSLDFAMPGGRRTWRQVLTSGDAAAPSMQPQQPNVYDAATLTANKITLTPAMVRALNPHDAQELFAGLSAPSKRASIRAMLPTKARSEFARWVLHAGNGGPVAAQTYTDTPVDVLTRQGSF